MLTGKKKWKNYRATVDKNQLLLSDPEPVPQMNNANNIVRIELKSDLQCAHTPRRNSDYRFKMKSSSAMYMYFLKCPTVFERDKWIEVLTLASRSVCHNSCAQCCRRYRSSTIEEGSQRTQDVANGEVDRVDAGNGVDDVFYVEINKDGDAVTFANPTNSETLERTIQGIGGTVLLMNSFLTDTSLRQIPL